LKKYITVPRREAAGKICNRLHDPYEMRVAYLSKSRKSDNRQIEQEMRYLRRMFAEIGKDVALPPSLHGDMLRPKLDGVTPDGLKVKTPFNAGDFLRS
jgi:hypothetical protein